MKLNKLTRKQLATGQPVTFPWPKSPVVPRKQRRYKLSTESGKSADREFVVLEVKEDAQGFTVTAQMHTDPIRLLGRRGGYTDRPSGAIGATTRQLRGNLWEEPEAVDDFTQKRITREARDRERQAATELILAVEDVRSAIRERIEANPAFRGKVGRSLYRLTAELDRMQKNAKRHAA